MKVLWLSNVLFPDVCIELGIKTPVVGGWMYAGAKALLQVSSDIQLGVVVFYDGNFMRTLIKSNITYFLVPNQRGDNGDSAYKQYFIEIKKTFNPEITHIHGSEYSHSLAYVNACSNDNVVVSIQGLVSVYAKYYLGGILSLPPSIRDILRLDTLKMQQKRMARRGCMEVKLLQKAQHFIGRTSWDRNHIWEVNPKADYYFCNETLRDSFYSNRWNLNECEQYSIFLSQAHYPIKGLQQIIKCLPIVLKYYPNTKVYVAGNNFISVPRYRRSGFASYIEKLMIQNNVKDCFTFLGTLNEEQMVLQYKKAHVFVCPSVIENSPNSVGEAQLLGTPCVASYVGGTMDLIESKESGLLYRYEEYSMLAEHICSLFRDMQLCIKLSINGRKVAQERHDSKKNASRLLDVYHSIIVKQ